MKGAKKKQTNKGTREKERNKKKEGKGGREMEGRGGGGRASKNHYEVNFINLIIWDSRTCLS